MNSNAEVSAPGRSYPAPYYVDNEVVADLLVLGGGLAGCFPEIAAARRRTKVAMAEKAATARSGSTGEQPILTIVG